MDKPTPWTPEKGLLFYRLERRLWANWAGSGYQFLKYSNGVLRRFWTRAQAQAHADRLNAAHTAAPQGVE